MEQVPLVSHFTLAFACLNLILNYGAKKENCILCDTKGVCYKGRKLGMNEFKERLSNDTSARTF